MKISGTLLMLSVLLGSGTANAATLTKLIDFQYAGKSLATGYTPAEIGVSLTTVDPAPIALGDGISLDVNGAVRTWSGTGDSGNPLDDDGWLAFGDSSGLTVANATFELTGLTPGSLVTMYGISAWDGAGRAGLISFGGGPIVDLNTSSNAAGASPIIPTDFALVASNVLVPGTGILSGSIYEDEADEGQFGGFVFEITTFEAPVPEPSSITLLGLGMGLILARRKRSK